LGATVISLRFVRTILVSLDIEIFHALYNPLRINARQIPNGALVVDSEVSCLLII